MDMLLVAAYEKLERCEKMLECYKSLKYYASKVVELENKKKEICALILKLEHGQRDSKDFITLSLI